MATRDELIQATLEKLNVVGVGETPTSEDVQVVGRHVDNALKDLASRQVYFVGNPDQIPLSALEQLAVVARNFAAASYGQAYSADAVLLAENRLRETRPGDGAGSETIKHQYF